LRFGDIVFCAKDPGKLSMSIEIKVVFFGSGRPPRR
jgi:hypothetical protein